MLLANTSRGRVSRRDLCGSFGQLFVGERVRDQVSFSSVALMRNMFLLSVV